MAKKNKNSSSVSSKEKLLAAALDVFSHHGYHGTTTKMISVAAGVNEALISRHFLTKHGLFVEVVKKNVIQEESELPYPPKDNLRDELIAFSKFIYQRDQKNKEFLRILIGHALQDESFAGDMQAQIALPISRSVIKRLKILQKKKKIPQKTDLHMIEQVVKSQIFAAIFFSSLCGLYDDKKALGTLRFALGNFAEGLLTNA